MKALHDVTLATYPGLSGGERRAPNETNKGGTDDGRDETTSSEARSRKPPSSRPSAPEQRTTSTGTLRVTERDQGGAESRTLFGKFQAAGWHAGRQPHRDLLERLRDGVREPGAHLVTASRRQRQPALRVARGRSATTSGGRGRRSTRVAGRRGVTTRERARRRPPDADRGRHRGHGRSTRSRRSRRSAARSTMTADEHEAGRGVVARRPEHRTSRTATSSRSSRNDLRLAYADGLDFHACAQIVASAGTQTLSTDPLLNVDPPQHHGCCGALGYNPDTLLLTPANSETLDTVHVRRHRRLARRLRVRGGPVRAAERSSGCNVRVSKNIAQPGRRSTAPRSASCTPARSRLQRSRRTPARRNSSLLRFEGNARARDRAVNRGGQDHISLGRVAWSSGFPQGAPPARLDPLGPRFPELAGCIQAKNEAR